MCAGWNRFLGKNKKIPMGGQNAPCVFVKGGGVA